MVDIAGIRFKRAGRVYYFDSAGIDLEVNDYVVVKTARGLELGEVVISPKQVLSSEVTKPLKPIVRKAEADDVKHAQELEAKKREALVECDKQIAKLNLPMRLVSAEYSFDGSHLTFFFTSAERVDFRELVRELASHFKTRVELRQVGARDVAKLLGGFGRCGRPLCCMNFLGEFAPVSIRMAKEQDLPLNPVRISGVCGRLMCCLVYENEQYHIMKKKLPKEGVRVSTPLGVASVVGGNPLKETVLVELESGATTEVPLDEITIENGQRPKRG